jgi:hypothetical protein
VPSEECRSLTGTIASLQGVGQCCEGERNGDLGEVLGQLHRAQADADVTVTASCYCRQPGSAKALP